MIRLSLLCVLLPLAHPALALAPHDAAAPAAAKAPVLARADTADAAATGPAAPAPDAIEAYPAYDVSQTTERTVHVSPAQAAAIILDYTHQCKTCRYPVASVVSQEVFERDGSPHDFLVWQDVNKEINVLLGKIPFRSSSWTRVRVFQSADGDTIIIDSRLLDEERAQAKAAQYERPSKPAFALLQSRWTITALPPDRDGNSFSLIRGVAGGKGQGISGIVPGPVMRKELKGVMEETLDFVTPEGAARQGGKGPVKEA